MKIQFGNVECYFSFAYFKDQKGVIGFLEFARLVQFLLSS
jgi:hypothetical protein